MKTLFYFGFAFFLMAFLPLHSQETVSNIDSLLKVLRKHPADTSKALLYQKVGGHYNVTQLDSARTFFEQGLALSEKLSYQKGVWVNRNGLGNYFERKTQYDSAMYQYERALDVVKETNSTKGFAVVLNNIATIYIRRGEYETALQFLFDALKAEETLNNRNGIAQAFNNIGVVYYYTGNFDQTTNYLTKALEIQEALGNYDGLINGYNNVGAIYDYQKQYDDAIQSYEKGLEIARSIGDRKMEATQLSNIALAYSSKKEYPKAEGIFQEAVALREKIKDYNGEAFSYQGFGQMYLNAKNFAKAKFYLDKAFALAEAHDLKLVKKEALAALVEYYEAQKDYQSANAYLYRYLAVKDSILNEEKTKAIAELETQYETEKKEKEIVAQRAQLAEKDLEVRRKNTLVYGGFGLALVLALLGYLVYNQQKLKNRQLKKEGELKTALAKIETQNKLQEQRLRISRDLHDNIGSQLTFIISSLDNLKFGFPDMKEKLSQKLSGLSGFASQTIYELRDTIWAMNKNDISFEDLQARIGNFTNQAKSASAKTRFEFVMDEGIDRQYTFTSLEGINVYRIIQEAVNNSMKYADASTVQIKISDTTDGFHIAVMDDGKGFEVASVSDDGNGLKNMQKRARELGGTLTLASEAESGTQVILQIPKKLVILET
ncbi:MAG: sensor histidine kinase [Flavobacteriaceae bacterium]